MSIHGVSLHNSEITGYWFEDCHLDVRNRALRHGEETMAHNSKYFDVLHVLVREQGRLCGEANNFREGMFVVMPCRLKPRQNEKPGLNCS